MVEEVIKFRATDGTEFATHAEAADHEVALGMREKLFNWFRKDRLSVGGDKHTLVDRNGREVGLVVTVNAMMADNEELRKILTPPAPADSVTRKGWRPGDHVKLTQNYSNVQWDFRKGAAFVLRTTQIDGDILELRGNRIHGLVTLPLKEVEHIIERIPSWDVPS